MNIPRGNKIVHLINELICFLLKLHIKLLAVYEDETNYDVCFNPGNLRNKNNNLQYLRRNINGQSFKVFFLNENSLQQLVCFYD